MQHLKTLKKGLQRPSALVHVHKNKNLAWRNHWSQWRAKAQFTADFGFSPCWKGHEFHLMHLPCVKNWHWYWCLGWWITGSCTSGRCAFLFSSACFKSGWDCDWGLGAFEKLFCCWISEADRCMNLQLEPNEQLPVFSNTSQVLRGNRYNFCLASVNFCERLK